MIKVIACDMDGMLHENNHKIAPRRWKQFIAPVMQGFRLKPDSITDIPGIGIQKKLE